MNTTLELVGATCTSCVLGIEHMGRRLRGVEDISVNRTEGTIDLVYDGNQETIDKIVQFVDAIGYEARPRKE